MRSGSAPGSRTTHVISIGRTAGEAPYTLLDYFPKNYLTIIDKSHVTVPEIGGQYEGDHSRKEVLVEHGFRLPSAKDNRPLRFDEWLEKANQIVFLSATPSDFEISRSTQVVEQDHTGPPASSTRK